MRTTSRSIRLGRCGAALFLLAVAPLGAAGPAGPNGPAAVEAVTKPSEDVTLSFSRPGRDLTGGQRVSKILVKEGQLVRAGELLVQQDDSAEQVQLRQLKSQADSDVQVRAAQAKLDQAKVDYEKMAEAGRRNAAAPLEVEHAKLDMLIADLSLELARFMHDQDRLKYDDLKAQIDRLRIESPIAGRVEKISVQEGESKDAQQPIIRIVKIDPLWIDAPVPLKQSRGLEVGAAARVAFPGETGAAEGKIVFVGDVADAASDTLLVRVEVKNSSRRKAGEHVRVSFGGAAPTKDSQAASATQPKEPK
jgi:RND family efflux transporter MFP subunit